MSETAIKVEGLSKAYRIGLKEEQHDTFRDALMAWAKSPIENYRRLRRLTQIAEDEDSEDVIWALQDVSFSVDRGEVLGIIGRNGAGKSTLLKVLSRITEPTSGRAILNGRVASLLEVGTGFHDELTGRENVYMNGTLLGMTKAEVDRKFDEIVAFSGVEKFIDTPIKRYSSGMKVRLAFAVAAHLDPEILLIDEVLAVGDAAFQKKCLGKMDEVARSGRTVLFVSHNMGSIKELCTDGILIENGQITFRGNPSDAVECYMRGFSATGKRENTWRDDPSKSVRLLRAAICAEGKSITDSFDVNDSLVIHITYRVHKPTKGANLALIIRRDGTPILTSFDIDCAPERFEYRSKGTYRAQVHVPSFFLKAGRYTIHLDAGHSNIGVIDARPEALSFEIEEHSIRTTHLGYARKRPGHVILPLEWKLDY